MTALPKKTSEAKTGSNIPNNPILNHRKQLFATHKQAFTELAQDSRNQAKRIFKNADTRVAAKLAQEAKAEWRTASLTVGGDSTKIQEMKNSARKRLDKSIARTVPNYRDLQSLKKSHQRKYRNLIKALMRGTHIVGPQISWGNTLPARPDMFEFVAPYPEHEVIRGIEGQYGADVVEDESMVLPRSGNLIHNFRIDFEQDGSGWGMDEIFGSDLMLEYSSVVSCAVNLTPRRAGRLTIGALLKNHYNRIMLSASDYFGFSHVNLDLTLSLFVDVFRDAEVLYHAATPLLSHRLATDGSDASDRLTDLDQSQPYTVASVTPVRLLQDELVGVVVGSEIYARCELHNMISHVNAIVWWQLQKITLSVDTE